MSKKSAKFFCENCGAEVPRNSRICKHCGRFFSSVRCPQCGLTGQADKFANGCPQCGYSFSSQGKTKTIILREKKSVPAAKKKLYPFVNKGKSRANKKSNLQSDERLPIWIYFFTASVLAGVIAVFALQTAK